MNHFSINGVPIKNPTSFKKERFNVTNMVRLANGTMAGDLIAKKEKYYFGYDFIDATDMDVILDAIWSSTLFFNISYTWGGQSGSAEVYVGNIPSELYHASQNKWVWKNVTFDLIER